MAEFKDLLLKIANNQILTPQELQDLSIFGTETQQRNSFIAGNTAANNTLNIAFPFFPIYSEILTKNTSSITIPVPSNANHLFCIGAGRCSGATFFETINGTFNGDTGTNYNWNSIVGVNTTPTAVQNKNQSAFPWGYFEAASSTSGAQSSFFAFIPHIRSGFWKTVIVIGGLPEYSATDMVAGLTASHWRSTEVIQSITITPASSTILAGSLFSLFGFR
jgi:hypothetical protein